MIWTNGEQRWRFRHPQPSHMAEQRDRRRFLGILVAAVIPVLVPRSGKARTWKPHPTPRPGVTGAKVLSKAQLAQVPKVIPLFESIRRIPQVIDGIRCYCGCTHPPDFYSLLSCYEGEGMARDCVICQGQGRLAVRMHADGKTLEEIRAAIDAKYA